MNQTAQIIDRLRNLNQNDPTFPPGELEQVEIKVKLSNNFATGKTTAPTREDFLYAAAEMAAALSTKWTDLDFPELRNVEHLGGKDMLLVRAKFLLNEAVQCFSMAGQCVPPPAEWSREKPQPKSEPRCLMLCETSGEEGTFSDLAICQEPDEFAEDRLRASVHVTGNVARALLLLAVRCHDDVSSELLECIGRFCDSKLADTLTDPRARRGAGIIDFYKNGDCSCPEHRMAVPESPKVAGLDRAQELAQAANQAAA